MAYSEISEEAQALLNQAEGGDANAQFKLGMMYQAGRGVPQSDEEAVAWYRKAALQNHASAQNSLGAMYHAGRGVSQSDEEAMVWFHKAALQNHARAQYNLGLMFERGRGVSQSDEEAVVWYRKAALQNDAQAQYNLVGLVIKKSKLEGDFAAAAEAFRLLNPHLLNAKQQREIFTRILDCYAQFSGLVSYQELLDRYVEVFKSELLKAEFPHRANFKAAKTVVEFISNIFNGALEIKELSKEVQAVITQETKRPYLDIWLRSNFSDQDANIRSFIAKFQKMEKALQPSVKGEFSDFQKLADYFEAMEELHQFTVKHKGFQAKLGEQARAVFKKNLERFPENKVMEAFLGFQVLVIPHVQKWESSSTKKTPFFSTRTIQFPGALIVEASDRSAGS